MPTSQDIAGGFGLSRPAPGQGSSTAVRTDQYPPSPPQRSRRQTLPESTQYDQLRGTARDIFKDEVQQTIKARQEMAKARQAHDNASFERWARSSGARYYRNSLGDFEQEVDESGRPLFKESDWQVRDDPGSPMGRIEFRRNQYGIPEIRAPRLVPAQNDLGEEDIENPTLFFADGKPAGHVDDLALNGPAGVREQAEEIRKKRRDLKEKAAREVFDRQLAEADAELYAARGRMDVLRQEIDEIDQNPVIQEREGLIFRKPTERARSLQEQRTALEDELFELEMKTGPDGELTQRRQVLDNDKKLWEAERKLGRYDDLLARRRKILLDQGKGPESIESDPVYRSILATRERMGGDASQIAQARERNLERFAEARQRMLDRDDALAPDSPSERFEEERGRLEADGEKFRQLQAHFEQAKQAGAPIARLHEMQSDLIRLGGELTGRTENFNQALRGASSQPERAAGDRFEQAKRLMESGDTEQAEALLKEAVDLNADIDPPGFAENVRHIAGEFAKGGLNLLAGTPKMVVAMRDTLIDKVTWAAGLAGMDRRALRQKAEEAGLTGDVEESFLWQLGEEMQKVPEQWFPGNPQLQDSFWRTQVPQGVGSMAGFIVLGYLTRGRGLSLAGRAGLGGAIGRFLKNPMTYFAGAMAGTRGFEEALDAGADESTASTAFVANFPGGMLQVANVIPMVHRFDQLTQGRLSQSLTKSAVEVVTRGANEWLVEAGGQAWFNVAAAKLYDENRDFWEDVIPSGNVGGASGFVSALLMEGVAAAIGKRGLTRGSLTEGETRSVAAVRAMADVGEDQFAAMSQEQREALIADHGQTVTDRIAQGLDPLADMSEKLKKLSEGREALAQQRRADLEQAEADGTLTDEGAVELENLRANAETRTEAEATPDMADVPGGDAPGAPNAGDGGELRPPPLPPTIARGENSPERMRAALAEASGADRSSPENRFMAGFLGRLSRAAPDRFREMEVRILDGEAWASHPEIGRTAPDSSAAFDEAGNVMYFHADRIRGQGAVESLVHEAGHFAEKFYLGEDFTQREWSRLSDEQRTEAARQYFGDGAELPSDLLNDRRARKEWVAMQFSRVVSGDTDAMNPGLKQRLTKLLEDLRQMVKVWLGDKSLTTEALDREILRMLNVGQREATTDSAEIGSRSVDAAIRERITASGARAYELDVPVSEIVVNRDVPQFKEDSDAATGVVEGQQLEGEYDPVQAGRIVVWEKDGGEMEVITGRHRLDLARRQGLEDIPAFVMREADGFTQADAVILDAEFNIRDGQGKVKDYAHYFKNAGISREEALERGLLSRDKGRQGWALGQEAVQSVYDAYANGQLSQGKAVAIAEGAPGNEGAQTLAIRKAGSMNADQLRFYTRQLSRMEGVDPTGATQTGFDDLLGGEGDFARLEAEAEQVSRAQAEMLSETNELIRVANNASRNPKAAARMGIDVRNPEATRRQIEELRARAEALRDPDSETMNRIREHAGLEPMRDVPETDFGNPSEGVPEAEGQTEMFGSPAEREGAIRGRNGTTLTPPQNHILPAPAYHGTPHRVDRFSLDRIGTGEGSQAYGWGLYFAENPEVADLYAQNVMGPKATPASVARKVLNAGRDPARRLRQVFPRLSDSEIAAAIREAESFSGNLYEVDLDVKSEQLLDWDKPLSKQSDAVKAALNKALEEIPDSTRQGAMLDTATSAAEWYSGLSRMVSPSYASITLRNAGIPGIQYLDGQSRADGEGTRNYVIFDESVIRIVAENGRRVSHEEASGKGTEVLASPRLDGEAGRDDSARMPPQGPAAGSNPDGSPSPGSNARDAAYLDAVARGDMEAAQRMVDDAAKEAADFRGTHTAPTGEFGEGSLDAMNRTYPDDLYSADGPQFYGDGEPSLDRLSHRIILQARGNPDKIITAYRAVPKGVGGEILPGDWVTPNRKYAEMHGNRWEEGFDLLKKEVRAGDLYTEGKSIHEFGWSPKLPVIERDSSGNIIPLSERFRRPDSRAPSSGAPDVLSAPSRVTPEQDRTYRIQNAISISGATKRVFQSATDILRQAPGMAPLAKAIERNYDGESARLGVIKAQIDRFDRQHVKPLKRRERKELNETFSRYIAARENGRKAEAAKLLSEGPEALRAMVRLVETIAEVTGEINQTIVQPDGTVGSWVSDADAKGGKRMIGKIGREFWPRMFRPEVQRVLRDPSSDPELYNQLVDALIAGGHIENAGQMSEYLNTNVPDYSKSDYFAAIEQARKVQLPEIFYDYSFDAIIDYSRGWARRISQIESFGQKDVGTKGDLFEQMQAKAGDAATRKYVKAVADRVYNRTERSVWNSIMAHANMLATGIQLGNPATAALNLVSGGLVNFQTYGWRAATRGLIDTLKDYKAAKIEGVEKGVLMQDFNSIMRDTEDLSVLIKGRDLSAALRAFTDFTLRWGGYMPTETFIRTQAMMTGRHFLRDAREAWGRNPDGAKAKLKREFFERNGLDFEKLMLEGEKGGPETDRWLRAASNLTQGSYKVDQTPVWIDEPIGRFLFKYQKFSTQITRLAWREAVQPFTHAARHGTANERARTFIQMANYFGTAILSGMTVAMLRDEIFGYVQKGAEFDEIERALEDDDRARALALMFNRAMHSWVAAGTLGIFGNYGQAFIDFRDHERFKNPLAPPALGSLEGVGEIAFRLNEQGTLNARDMDEILERAFAFYRTYKRAGLTALNATGAEVELAQRQAAQKEIRWVRQRTRSYASEHDIVSKRTSSGRYARTEMSPVNTKINDALLLGDAARARAIVQEHLRSLTDPEERRRAELSMKSSVRSRQPIRVGDSTSEKTRQEFLRWARERLGAESYERIRRVDETYRKTAQRAGLM